MTKINWLIDFFYNLFFKKNDDFVNSNIYIRKKLILEGIEIDTRNSLDWKWIVLHHSWSPDNQKVNDWTSIKRYHMSWRYQGNIITEKKAKELIASGKKGVESPDIDIAYHCGCEYETLNGTLQLVFRIGRPLSLKGSHTKGFNLKAIGWCVIGNFDKKDMDSKQLGMFVRNAKEIMKYYNIPVMSAIGHWESYILLNKAKTKEEAQKIKSCPGLAVNMQNIRRLLI